MEFKRASEYDTKGFRAVENLPGKIIRRGSMEFGDLVEYFAMSNESFMGKQYPTWAEAKRVANNVNNAIKRLGHGDEMFVVQKMNGVYICKGKRSDFND